MKNIGKYTLLLTVFAFGIVFTSCQSDPDSPGFEYMPDMYRSPAVEAYVDYNNPEAQSALRPPKGTVPFVTGEDADIFLPYIRKAPLGADKTHGLFGWDFDAKDYDRSAEDKNPLEPTDYNLDRGKVLYGRYCSHCHGDKGAGDGAISQNGHIKGIPSYTDQLKDLPEGTIFYSITYGKGNMGAHASLLNKKERWQVVLHVQALQNGGSFPTGEENAEVDKENDDSEDQETTEPSDTTSMEEPVEAMSDTTNNE